MTQMRCGTTWMQQLVYQIVTQGQGEFSDPGRAHLYATSPWIEAINSVSMEDAPLVGKRPTKIIKSHLPDDGRRVPGGVTRHSKAASPTPGSSPAVATTERR